MEDTPQCRRSLAQEHLQLQRDLNDLSNIVQSLTVGRYHLSVFDELARCRKVELQQLQAKLDNPSDVSLGTLTTSSPIKRSFDKLLRRTSSESRSPTEDGTDAQHGWEEQRLKALKSAHQEKKRHMNDLCTSRESLKAYLDDLESRQKDLTIATDNWQSRMQRIYTYIFSTPSQFPQQDDMVLAQETATEACATATKDRHSAWMAHNFVLRGGKALRTTAIRLERILTKSTMVFI